MEKVFKEEEELEARASKLKREGWNFNAVCNHVCEIMEIERKELDRRGHKNAVSQGRALLCKWMVEDLGESRAEVAKRLGVSRPAMTKLVRRGRELEEDLGVSL